MKTALIAEPNILVAEDIAEIILGRWDRCRTVTVSSAEQGIDALRQSGAFEIAVLRLSQDDPSAEKLIGLLSTISVPVVMVDDAVLPTLSGDTPSNRYPDVQYLAQPFTTDEMLQALERALASSRREPRSA